MEMARFVQNLEADLAAVAAVGDEQTAAAAERLIHAIRGSAGLRLLDVLGEAALEISGQLPAGHVEVRVSGQDPSLVFVGEPEGEPEQTAADDGLTARKHPAAGLRPRLGRRRQEWRSIHFSSGTQKCGSTLARSAGGAGPAVRAETYSTPGPVTLTLGVPTGDISLETHDAPETYVELDASDAEALADATIELRERSDGFEVVVEARRKFRLLSWGDEYRLQIRAPHGADVDLKASSADVEARGRYGSVELTTASGDARFDAGEGEGRNNAAGGGVRLPRAGAGAPVNTASGDVEVETLEGRGKIRS